MLQRSTIVIIVLSVIVATEAGFIIWLALANKQHCKEQYKEIKVKKGKNDIKETTWADNVINRSSAVRSGGSLFGKGLPGLLRESNYE